MREYSWFAVHTRPRQERRAREHLERQRFECFLPLAENPFQRRSRGRAPRPEPLFPRYLFLHAAPDRQSLASVRSTRGVVGLVRAGPAPLRAPDALIAALQARQQAGGGCVRLDPVPLLPGDGVRVFDGPLAGLEGVLRERCGAHRSILLLNLMGRETTVEVDSLLLQRAS